MNKKKTYYLLVLHDVASGTKECAYQALFSNKDRAEEKMKVYDDIKSFKPLRLETIDAECVESEMKVPWWKKLWMKLTMDGHKWYYLNVIHDNVDEMDFVNSNIFGCWDDAVKHRDQQMYKENFDYVGTIAFWSDYPYHEWKFDDIDGRWV